jgi:site-specific recombinase XerD
MTRCSWPVFHRSGDPWLEARDAAMVELLYGAGCDWVS